jgi:hypothetical protein
MDDNLNLCILCLFDVINFCLHKKGESNQWMYMFLKGKNKIKGGI